MKKKIKKKDKSLVHENICSLSSGNFDLCCKVIEAIKVKQVDIKKSQICFPMGNATQKGMVRCNLLPIFNFKQVTMSYENSRKNKRLTKALCGNDPVEISANQKCYKFSNGTIKATIDKQFGPLETIDFPKKLVSESNIIEIFNSKVVKAFAMENNKMGVDIMVSDRLISGFSQSGGHYHIKNTPGHNAALLFFNEADCKRYSQKPPSAVYRSRHFLNYPGHIVTLQIYRNHYGYWLHTCTPFTDDVVIEQFELVEKII